MKPASRKRVRSRKPRAIYIAGTLLAELQGHDSAYGSVTFGDLVQDNATNLLWPEEARKLAAWLIRAADYLDDRKSK